MQDGPAMVLLRFGGPYGSPNADSSSAFEKKVQGSTSVPAEGAPGFGGVKTAAVQSTSVIAVDRILMILVVDRDPVRAQRSRGRRR
jgi:hypothetical protein